MIRNTDQYRKADAWLKRQQKRMEAGHPPHPRYEEARDHVIVYQWRDEPTMSEHTRLEVAASAWIGKPLEPGQPVPGCSCEACTGVPAKSDRSDSPVTATDDRRKGKGRAKKRDLRPAIDLDRARAVPIMDVAQRLGIEVNRSGWATCPFHEDTNPSFHVNTTKQRAYCNPCGRSWDGIQLMVELGNMEFIDAVKKLAA